MAIENLDKIEQRKLEIANNLAQSIRDNDEAATQLAMKDLSEHITSQVMAKAEALAGVTDTAVLASRGIRQLTTKETEYYNKLISSAKQEGVITNIADALPETVVDAVLDEIRTAHPLLDAIDFVNTSAAIKWVFNGAAPEAVTWDALNTPIAKSLQGAVEIIDMTLCKATAYMFCTKDMLILGPSWVDAYIRTFLAEALAIGLESAIVDGDGVDKPVGMTRNFKGSYNDSTGYSRKSATAVTSLNPTAYGSLLSMIAKDRNGNSRPVTGVVLIVNPTDYFTKLMPATTVMTPTGTYISNVLPYPTTIIQSVGVPSGHAVLGIGKNYFMGIGTAKGGKLEYSDEYKFVEDLRTYLVRFYGNGRAKDINSFVYLDISGLEPAYLTVKSVTSDGETA